MDTFTEPLPDTETGASPTTSDEHHGATTPASETGSTATPTNLAAVLKRLGKAIEARPPKPTGSAPWRTASVARLIADDAPRPEVTDSTDDGTNGGSIRSRWRPPPSLTPEQIAELPALIARGHRSVQPAAAEAIGALLLKLVAVHPMGERAGVDLMMDVYVEDLSDLPADLIEGAAKRWRQTERFFPTIAELRALATPELAKRRKFLERLLVLQDVAKLPAPDGIVTHAWLTDRRAAGRRAVNVPALRLSVAA